MHTQDEAPPLVTVALNSGAGAGRASDPEAVTPPRCDSNQPAMKWATGMPVPPLLSSKKGLKKEEQLDRWKHRLIFDQLIHLKCLTGSVHRADLSAVMGSFCFSWVAACGMCSLLRASAA